MAHACLSAAGTYAITPSAAVGLGLSNYTIAYIDGTLTVTGGRRPWVPQPASGGTVSLPVDEEDNLFCSAGRTSSLPANDNAVSMPAC